MKILLAGYNLDSEVIEELKRGSSEKQNITPEVLSASYARISRDSRSIDELRNIARTEVEKARRSNEAIIFDMGHNSVAEHAAFNFDLIDVSRLAMEEIEKFRLCSYTEKSQRYQKLEDNYIIPEEIKESGMEKIFVKTAESQNSFYAEMAEKGIPAEDARYITSLSTLGQVGMTLNARNLELLIRRFAASPLHEVRTIGKEMYDRVKDIAPSIVRHTAAAPLDTETYKNLKAISLKFLNTSVKSEEVKIAECEKNQDIKTIAAILHTTTGAPYLKCKSTAKKMGQEEKELLIKTALENMEFFNSTIREFEYPEITYEIALSAAAFGQLKRHRIATLTSQSYNPKLGIKIPHTIKEKGLEALFEKVAKESEKTYKKILKKHPEAAPYILTNAHKKRVLFKCNMRELYHISRLREDKHAQWDIQELTKKMTGLAKEQMPLTTLTMCGKDSYIETYEKVFGKKPKAFPKH